MLKSYHRVTSVGVPLVFIVIVLGAWVRLTDAGLGCPDWPGCYGQLTWPQATIEVQSANQAFPERPVEIDKAWKEMVHRYVAGSLILLVAVLNWLAWRGADTTRHLRGLTASLLVLILFQAALGMWTVTLKLKPVIVMLHLLGGMATLALLTWAWHASRSNSHHESGRPLPALRRWVVVGLAVLVVQIALGGWTSANYAALVCPDLPTCMGQWAPPTDFREGFVLWREIGVDYEGGILDLASRTAIHLTHRIGAVVTLLALLWVAFRLARETTLQRLAIMLGLLVSIQFALGLLNILLRLPLANAVAHNAGAALLLGVMTTLLYRTSPRRP